MTVVVMSEERLKRVLSAAMHVYVDHLFQYHRSEKGEADLRKFKQAEVGILEIMAKAGIVADRIVMREKE